MDGVGEDGQGREAGQSKKLKVSEHSVWYREGPRIFDGCMNRMSIRSISRIRLLYDSSSSQSIGFKA